MSGEQTVEVYISSKMNLSGPETKRIINEVYRDAKHNDGMNFKKDSEVKSLSADERKVLNETIAYWDRVYNGGKSADGAEVKSNKPASGAGEDVPSYMRSTAASRGKAVADVFRQAAGDVDARLKKGEGFGPSRE